MSPEPAQRAGHWGGWRGGALAGALRRSEPAGAGSEFTPSLSRLDLGPEIWGGRWGGGNEGGCVSRALMPQVGVPESTSLTQCLQARAAASGTSGGSRCPPGLPLPPFQVTALHAGTRPVHAVAAISRPRCRRPRSPAGATQTATARTLLVSRPQPLAPPAAPAATAQIYGKTRELIFNSLPSS